MAVLSGQQTTVFDDIMSWLSDSSGKQFYVLAGYAGTGKSTLAAKISEEIGEENVAYCAYTGKAANVLREKGCLHVDTLHGWLYTPAGHDQETINRLLQSIAEAENAQDIATAQQLRKELEERQKEAKKPRFTLNTESYLKRVDLVIVDEYSMLYQELIDDLAKVAKKVLFIGDPYQLPPVKGECGLQPDSFLEEIHRQSLESSIIRFSKEVREGGNIPFGSHGDLDFLLKKQVDKQLFLDADQLIVGKNATRAAMNNWYRHHLGFTEPYPHSGEKLICLKNNKFAGLYNGRIGLTQKKARFSGLFCHLDFDGLPTVKAFTDDLLGRVDKYDYRNPAHRELDRFAYGYAITCHKSQGSEFETLAVINEPVGRGEDRRRWLYTAITRSKKKCTLIQPS